jgi:adenine/guanine phosphoribosyltransferase-like PRPP-binding protein
MKWFQKQLASRFAGIPMILVSAHAIENVGVNAIPEALANCLAQKLHWRADSDIVQTNIVAHTGADGFSRLARQAKFEGAVTPNQCYLLVDDFVGQGGTLANLRSHIIQGAAKVMGATVLTGKPYSANLALTETSLNALRSKHG